MQSRSRLPGYGAALATMLLICAPAAAQRDSSGKVAAAAELGPVVDGQQRIIVTLTVANGWYIYANPVGHEAFEAMATGIEVRTRQDPAKLSIAYPAGKLKEDKFSNLRWRIYEGKIVIPITLQRAAGDTASPVIDVSIRADSTSGAGPCLLPGRIRLSDANGHVHVPRK